MIENKFKKIYFINLFIETPDILLQWKAETRNNITVVYIRDIFFFIIIISFKISSVFRGKNKRMKKKMKTRKREGNRDR